MPKAITLDVDPTIIEKNLMITEESRELDSLFPKQENPSKLIKPSPVSNKMSDDKKLPDSNDSNLNDNTDTSSKNSTSGVAEKSILIEKELVVQVENILPKGANKTPIQDGGKTETQPEIPTETKDPTSDPKDGISVKEKESTPGEKEQAQPKGPTQTNKTQNDDVETDDLTLEYDYSEDQLLNDTTIDDQSKTIAQKNDTKQSAETTVSGENPEKVAEEPKDNETASKQSPQTTGRSLWVSGLSRHIRANDLKHHFASQGRVIGAKVVSSSRETNARCYGYIVMSTPEEADACIKNLHHSKLLNRFISIRKAKPGKENENAEDGKPSEGSQTSLLTSSTKNENDKEDVAPAANDAADKDKDKDKDKKDKNDEKSEKRKSNEKDKERKTRERSSRKRHETSSERNAKKSIHNKLQEQLDRKAERYQRLKEEREKERINNEQRRLRELQRRQREEAEKLDRERQLLRIERERLQREKMELLRLEKEQLEKEREELRRQKQKIEEAARKKRDSHERLRNERSKRHRDRSLDRRSPPVPPAKAKKYEPNRDAERRRGGSSDRHHRGHKHRTEPHTDKHSHRGDYKSPERDYNRAVPTSKYNRYEDDKKLSSFKSRELGAGNREVEITFEPPPPRISTNEANRFNVLSMSQVNYGAGPSSRIRGEFFESTNSTRSVDRVSDRFPVDPRDPRDAPYVAGFGTSKMSAPSRIDRFDHRLDSSPARGAGAAGGRYHENERDSGRYRDQWYPEEVHGASKRVPYPAPVRGGSWTKSGRADVPGGWESTRHYDSGNLHPPGVYGNNLDRR